jgi:hypothetical protein
MTLPSVELGGIGVDGQRSSITIPVEIAVISGDEAKLAFANCSGDWPKIGPDQVSISMIAGTPNASDVASLNQWEKIRQQVVSETARRQAYIAKLPLLNSRSGVAFVGSDRKCAEQFQQAVTLEV